MVFIIIKNDNILTVCDSIEQSYHHILTYIRVILYSDKKTSFNGFNFLSDLKILEYLNGCPKNSFKIDFKTLDLYDENNNKIFINNLSLQKQKVELEVLLKKDVESEVNLFIPINDLFSDQTTHDELNDFYIKNTSTQLITLQEQPSNVQSSEQSLNIQNQNLIKNLLINKTNKTNNPKLFMSVLNNEDQIQQKNNKQTKEDIEISIKMIKAKIELEKIKLDKNNINYDLKLNHFLENKHQYGLLELELKNKKEKEEENIRIFKVDKHTYNCIIKEIEEKTRDNDDIPEMLIIKYKIFEKLRLENKNLTESEEYKKYNEIKNTINYKITKSTNYDGIFTNNQIYDKLCNDLQTIDNNNNDDSENETDDNDIDDIIEDEDNNE